MLRAKVYIGVRVPREKVPGLYPQLQGETIELSDEEIRNWEQTKQRLIDGFVQYNKSIDISINGMPPNGIMNRNWRKKVVGKLTFDRPVVVEIEKPELIPKPEKERLTRVQRINLLRAIISAVASGKKEQILQTSKTRIYKVRPWGKTARSVVISRVSGKMVRVKNASSLLMRKL